ncbi:unnamed protein product [Tuber melanosporum]|uniref:(Perigord truffle) hypothetical protein n=1 Tax=Tuber melanosporum (strain Mel28) TaxID=656061 RepID=D5GEF1_TUBMM|nr:uncharacterized protein GSTUM_00006454001 [Tuber melanosporum]CAZ82894.1 unnamed protein product [Tuber melanosporum]
MYLDRPFVLHALLVLSLFCGIALSGGENIHRRQDGNVALTTSNNRPSADAEVVDQTSISRAATNTASNAPSSTRNAQSSDPSPTSGGKNAGETIKSSPAPTMAESGDNLSLNTNPADEIYQGVAGVLLLLAGIPYCLIGIKIKFLHIFLSTALLASLGVTVLVVYVMNPPVKFAIQGAYVTAATITGLLTGSLAVVFPEVTEALGCLLGGFCVSMWFLVLKPGGLVASVYGKLILIAVFCFALFALAFHRLTKPYSLIFSLSFSGATTIVLGIDCFSRAGLKEFWLYIWALNDNIFPLETDNYPHTRGIRVEIAIIVLITGFGIMSQVKLWNILKERRDAKDAERRRQDADIEAMDADAGLRVEEEHKLEREQWEATFGRKKADEVIAEERPATGRISRTDSGLGDDVGYGKSSIERAEEFVETEEMRREREEHIQMAQMGVSRSQSISESGGGTVKSQGPAKHNQALEDVDKIEPVEGSEAPKHEGAITHGSVSRRQSSQSIAPSYSNQSTPQRLSSQPVVSQEAPVQGPDVPPPPVVIPLPFPIPVEMGNDDDEVSSLATFAGSDRVISQEIDEDAFRSVVKMVDEEDRASSVAATLDDNEDEVVDPAGDDFSPIMEPPQEDSPPHIPLVKIEVEEVLDESRNRDPDPGLVGEEAQVMVEDKSERAESPGSGKSDAPLQNNAEKEPVTEDHSKRTDSPDETTLIAPTSVSTPPSTLPPPVVSTTPVNLAQIRGVLTPASTPKSKSSSPSPSSAETQLSAKCSKVLKNYRTNEWAKHLADAELPELDKLEEAPEAIDAPDETPAPVHIEELQETAAIKPPAPPRPVSKTSSHENPYPMPVPVNRSPAQLGKSRPSIRNSSSPNPLPESVSPVERSMSPTGRATPIPFTQNTLIGKRESMVRSRQSFNALAEHGSTSPAPAPQPPPEPKHHQPMAIPAPNAPFVPQRQSTGPFAQLPTSDNKSAYKYRLNMLDDDMPLADRRNELLQHVVPQAGVAPVPPQPQRRSLPPQVDRREAMLKNWRETVKTELQTSGHATHAIQERRGEMLNERMQSIQNERHKNLKENFRDEMFDERMRQKDMLDLHKEAMRRMQASANKHI